MTSGRLQDDSESIKRALSEHSESTKKALREYLKGTQRAIREKESNQISSYRRSLKYFVLLRQFPSTNFDSLPRESARLWGEVNDETHNALLWTVCRGISVNCCRCCSHQFNAYWYSHSANRKFNTRVKGRKDSNFDFDYVNLVVVELRQWHLFNYNS